ncbi:MAG: NRDE family protein [Rudaea sp.]
MCLLLLAIDSVPDRPWLLLGNRDEFHARPTAPAQAWEDAPAIVGGRDLQAGGSWLAIARSGRYAAVTNVRSGSLVSAPRSRGELVGDFVAGKAAPADYVAAVAQRRGDYAPFNLIVGNATAAWFVSSIDGVMRHLARGIHAFSNGSLEDEWPKMRRLRAHFTTMLQSGEIDNAAWLALLADTEQPQDGELPDTGVGLELERRLAPIFIRGETYGTRASTLAYARADGGMVLCERRFGPNAVILGESMIEL